MTERPRDERSREEPSGPRAKQAWNRVAGRRTRAAISARAKSSPSADSTKRTGRTRFGFGGFNSAAVIGILTLLLGFGIAVQVQANSGADSLSGLREADLIGILDNQNARAERLRVQAGELQATLRRLQDSGNRALVARQQAQQEARALGVLLGTLPATGPGVGVDVTDPGRKLSGEDLLDIVQELRGAGAEAIQFGSATTSVRVSTTTSFSGAAGSDISVDSTTLRPPYRVVAIGDPTTLGTALNIPGGVAATVRAAGGELTVSERGKVTISVVRTLPETIYAKPR